MEGDIFRRNKPPIGGSKAASTLGTSNAGNFSEDRSNVSRAEERLDSMMRDMQDVETLWMQMEKKPSKQSTATQTSGPKLNLQEQLDMLKTENLYSTRQKTAVVEAQTSGLNGRFSNEELLCMMMNEEGDEMKLDYGEWMMNIDELNMGIPEKDNKEGNNELGQEAWMLYKTTSGGKMKAGQVSSTSGDDDDAYEYEEDDYMYEEEEDEDEKVIPQGNGSHSEMDDDETFNYSKTNLPSFEKTESGTLKPTVLMQREKLERGDKLAKSAETDTSESEDDIANEASKNGNKWTSCRDNSDILASSPESPKNRNCELIPVADAKTRNTMTTLIRDKLKATDSPTVDTDLEQELLMIAEGIELQYKSTLMSEVGSELLYNADTQSGELLTKSTCVDTKDGESPLCSSEGAAEIQDRGLPPEAKNTTDTRLLGKLSLPELKDITSSSHYRDVPDVENIDVRDAGSLSTTNIELHKERLSPIVAAAAADRTETRDKKSLPSPSLRNTESQDNDDDFALAMTDVATMKTSTGDDDDLEQSLTVEGITDMESLCLDFQKTTAKEVPEEPLNLKVGQSDRESALTEDRLDSMSQTLDSSEDKAESDLDFESTWPKTPEFQLDNSGTTETTTNTSHLQPTEYSTFKKCTHSDLSRGAAQEPLPIGEPTEAAMRRHEHANLVSPEKSATAVHGPSSRDERPCLNNLKVNLSRERETAGPNSLMLRLHLKCQKGFSWTGWRRCYVIVDSEYIRWESEDHSSFGGCALGLLKEYEVLPEDSISDTPCADGKVLTLVLDEMKIYMQFESRQDFILWGECACEYFPMNVSNCVRWEAADRMDEFEQMEIWLKTKKWISLPKIKTMINNHLALMKEEKLLIEHPNLNTYLQLIYSPGFFLIVMALTQIVNLDQLVNCLLKVYLFGDCTSNLVRFAIKWEVSHTSSIGSLFRLNSFASKCIRIYTHILCKDYIVSVCKNTVEKVVEAGNHLEIDPSRLRGDKDKQRKNLNKLKKIVNLLFNDICSSIHLLPVECRKICRDLKYCAGKKFEGNTNAGDIAVFGYLILRLISPALNFPDNYHLVSKNALTNNSRRALLLVSKVLLNIMTQVTFTKEVYLFDLNEFIQDKFAQASEFLTLASTVPKTSTSTKSPSRPTSSMLIHIDDYFMHMSLLYHNLYTNIAEVQQSLKRNLDILKSCRHCFRVLGTPQDFDALFKEKIKKYQKIKKKFRSCKTFNESLTTDNN